MARPPKDPHLRMATDLRIPMTQDQKQLMAEATSDEPSGMAAWARSVLMDAARKKLGQRQKGKAVRQNR